MQVTVQDPDTKDRGLAFTTKTDYDALGNKATVTNAKGVMTKYQYDNEGSLLTTKVQKSVSDPEQLINTNTYDNTGKLLTQTDAKGNQTKYEYNAFGKIRKAEYPGDTTIPANTVTYLYDKMGNLKRTEDSLGAVDQYEYDNEGRVLSHTEKKADGTEAITTTAKYDAAGNKRFETDGKQIQTEYTYDELDRLETETRGGHTTTYGYDPNGNLTTTTDWVGNTTTSEYDPINRLIKKYDADNKTIQRLEYNHNNAQVFSYDANNKITEYQYDKNNRLLKTIDPLNHSNSQTYDAAGNISTKKNDDRNITTNYEYDEFNRLVTVRNALNETTSYTYDPNGNMLSKTDGKNNVTYYEYNAANKAVKRIDPGGRSGTAGNYTYDMTKVESYTYYADGSLKEKTDRNGIKTEYTYDIHGRLKTQTTGVAPPTPVVISYTYDDNGNQLTMTDSTGTTVRTYDDFNRVLTKSVPGVTGGFTYTYDTRTTVDPRKTYEESTDPKGNTVVKTYDHNGRLETVASNNNTTTYSYYGNGSVESVEYPGLAKEEYTYYDDGLLYTLVNKKADGTIIDSYTYEYDGAHNLTKKTDSKGVTEYGYDALNRLQQVTEPGNVTTYTYDMSGNRSTETVTAGTDTYLTEYSYNEQNRLTGYSVKTNGTVTETVGYTYDNNGNQLTSVRTPVGQTAQTTANEYDLLNQLTKTTTPDGKIQTSAYNGDGLRVEKTYDGQTTKYLYEYDKVVLELDGSGNQTAANIYGTNLLTRTAGSDTYYYMYNGHADVTALLTTGGAIAGTYYYDAFGNISEQTGNVNNNITYAGYQYDSETGLYYLNTRMYDPKVARFLQEDTYTGDPNDPLSLNLYTYCHNEPLMYVDPTGHIFEGIGNWLNKKIFKPVKKKVKSAEKWLDKNVINPVTGKVSDAAEWVDNSIVHPVEDFVVDKANIVIKPAGKVVNNVVKKVKSTDAYKTASGIASSVGKKVNSVKKGLEKNVPGFKFAEDFVVGFKENLIDSKISFVSNAIRNPASTFVSGEANFFLSNSGIPAQISKAKDIYDNYIDASWDERFENAGKQYESNLELAAAIALPELLAGRSVKTPNLSNPGYGRPVAGDNIGVQLRPTGVSEVVPRGFNGAEQAQQCTAELQ